MNRYQHLFFDLDNTLLDFSYASHKAFPDVLSHFGHSFSEGAYRTYSGINAQVWEEFEQGKIDALTLRKQRFQLFIDEMKWEGDGAEWNAKYLELVIDHTAFVPGAQQVLDSIKDQFHLHLVTNGLKEVQRPRLKQANITSLFTTITVSDEIGFAKPNADFFDHAHSSAGSPPLSECLMIGDSYGSDITGGHNYGMDTCWLSTKSSQEVIPTHQISQINELLEILF